MNAERNDDSRQRAVFKTLAALSFIGACLSLGAWKQGLPGHALLIGLCFGALGDVLLIPEGNGTPFKLGIGSFALSHVLYVVMFALLGVHPIGAAALVVLVPLGWFVWTWLKDGVGRLAVPVIGYITIITVMVAAATGSLVAEPSAGRGVLLAAAVVFFVSDLCVARHRFVHKALINRTIGQPLYFGAQLLFSYGIWLS